MSVQDIVCILVAGETPPNDGGDDGLTRLMVARFGWALSEMLATGAVTVDPVLQDAMESILAIAEQHAV